MGATPHTKMHKEPLPFFKEKKIFRGIDGTLRRMGSVNKRGLTWGIHFCAAGDDNAATGFAEFN